VPLNASSVRRSLKRSKLDAQIVGRRAKRLEGFVVLYVERGIFVRSLREILGDEWDELVPSGIRRVWDSHLGPNIPRAGTPVERSCVVNARV
jgi:hypothetical protein